MGIQERILEKLIRNRISTVEVADARGKKGGIKPVEPANSGHYEAGKVHFVYAYEESNWPVHEQIEDVPEDSIVIIETIDCNERAVIGDIMMKYMLLYRGASAVVVNGHVRDMHRIKKENYPLWSQGGSPIGCFNRKPENPPDQKKLERLKNRYEGAIAVCDDSGVGLIPPEDQTEEFIEKLDFIELQEDIWYYCVDTLKMTTYETICEKQYLDNPDMIPEVLRERLNEMQSDEFE
jgi:regulator of RNase E activity RraA